MSVRVPGGEYGRFCSLLFFENFYVFQKSIFILLRVRKTKTFPGRCCSIMKETAGNHDRLPKMFIAAVCKCLQILLINILRKVFFKIFILLSTGDRISRSASDIPFQHDFKHMVSLWKICRHCKWKFIPQNSLAYITKRPEKFIAASLVLRLRRSLDMKIFICWRGQLRKASCLIDKRKEQFISVASTFHRLHGFDADVDPIAVFKDQKPGIGFIIVTAQAETVPIAESVVLLLSVETALTLEW